MKKRNITKDMQLDRKVSISISHTEYTKTLCLSVMQTCIGESKFLNIESKHQSKEFELQDDPIFKNLINLKFFYKKNIFIT